MTLRSSGGYVKRAPWPENKITQDKGRTV